ncbi:MAG TPA: GtrA family protein [Burkholderiales bacterium]|nr:GtrA family protein [Burkholderiales bacterium]
MLRGVLGEGTRYFAASAAAFAVDFGLYVALVRLAEVHYLVAAPIAFALGLATIYALSIRWVFADRRLTDARIEFAVFASIGIGGMALNQGVLYAGVELFSLSYELAKLASTGIVFCFNFVLRKLLLFTRY